MTSTFTYPGVYVELDLDHPELATLHGHGEFFVPAYAGLTLDAGGGLRARAAVAYAQGRVGLQGTLGIQADASAGLDVDWSPTSGLAVETRVAANVRPKFRLSANASVTIGVDLLVTDVSHTFGPWQRTLGEFGPDMEFGVEYPVRWSEATGLDLSLDNIVVHQPTLDAGSLMTSVFDQLAGESGLVRASIGLILRASSNSAGAAVADEPPGCSMRAAVGCRHEHARGLPSRGAVLG